MKLYPEVNYTEHEIQVTDHLTVFGFDVIVKFKQDSYKTGEIAFYVNITNLSWMTKDADFSSKAICMSSVIHKTEYKFESYDIEYIVVDLATKLTCFDDSDLMNLI